jgi:hypothetical protein
MRATYDIMTRQAGLTLAFFAFAFVAVKAQQPPEDAALGFLRFVNATGFDENVVIKLDGEPVSPNGYKAGQATGAVGFLPTVCQIEMEHPTFGEEKLSVTLKPGIVSTVVALPEVEEPKKPGDEPKIKLAHHVLEAPVTGRRGEVNSLTLLQITPAELLNLKVADRDVALSRLKPDTVAIPGSAGDFPVISIAGTPVCTLNYTDNGDQVLVLFTDRKGRVKHVSFNNAAQ